VKFSKKIFSEKLKLEAERLGKNLDVLGKDAGISNLYLYTQKDSKIPRADTLQKLAGVGVNINYLLTFNETKYGAIVGQVKEPIDNDGSCIAKDITELKNEIKKVREEIEEVRARNRELINDREKCWEFIKQLGLENQFLKIFVDKINPVKQNSLDTS
jgi:transcriptional regulator with XRE-family HTH domain